jgi:hypothetical protein
MQSPSVLKLFAKMLRIVSNVNAVNSGNTFGPEIKARFCVFGLLRVIHKGVRSEES